MKTALFLLAAWLHFALPATALDVKAITRKPTADNPQFENRKAWPDLVGDEYFLKQKWAKARLLIWAPAGGTKKTDGFNRAFAKLVPKITVRVSVDTQIENVRFEDLHRGGIVLPDVAAAAKRKNVTYGNGCLSKGPKDLLREYKGKLNRGRPMEPLKPEEKYTSTNR